MDKDLQPDPALNYHPDGAQTPSAVDSDPIPAPAPNAPLASSSNTLPSAVGPSKAMIFGGLAAVLVLTIGGGLAWWVSSHKQATGPSVALATKKDISLIRYATIDSHVDPYPPAYPSNTISSFINHQMYETLVAYENGNKIIPLLAKSWTNPDNNTWIFKLEPNVKFHTGRIMEASDVKGSLEAAQKSQGYETFTDSIKSVEAVDALTVKITTKQPDAVLLNKLGFVFIYDTQSSLVGDPVTGSGPYVIKPGTSKSPEVTDMIAFEGYHGGHVYTKEAIVRNIADTKDIAKAYLDGNAEIANGLTEEDVANITSSSTLAAIVAFPSNSVFSLMLNTVKGPLSSLKLRQALMLAIDPQKIISITKISAIVANQAVPASVPGFNPDIKRPAMDIAKAKQLVIDAGYPKGVTLNMYYIKSQLTTVNEITAQLAAIGVTVKPSLSPGPDYFTTLQDGKTDMGLSGFASDINDASDVIAAQMQSGNLYKIYKNPRIDSLQAEANTTFDPAKRLTLLQQIMQIGADDVFQVPIRIRTSKSAINKAYIYTQDVPNSTNLGIFFWKMYQK